MQIPSSLAKWKQGMREDSGGRQIIENLEVEENVPADVSSSFFETLDSLYSGKISPMETLGRAVSSVSKAALDGPEVSLGTTLLTRFAKLVRLLDRPELGLAGINLARLVERPELVDKIEELPLGNRRGIVWAALNKPIDKDLVSGTSAEATLERLGICETQVESFYRVIYDTGAFDGSCHVPTVLDAGTDARFRPAPAGATQGMTRPWSGNGVGYPEYVHEKCVVRRPKISVHSC